MTRRSPLREFLSTESAGGALLVVGAIVAMVWANGPWSHSYETFWRSDVRIAVADHVLHMDLRHWVNDGLMTVFFFVVGLEIKRELAGGHLKSRRAAALPIAGALGGMIVPALIYLAIAGRHAARGWAVPTATDIALALGVIALAGNAVPARQRVFLLALAIVDDIGAIVVIAVAYSNDVDAVWLLIAAAAFALAAAARAVGVRWTVVYVGAGLLLWLGLHEGGLHATLTGVAMGLLAPTTPHTPPELIDVDELVDVSTVEHARATTDIARRSVSVVEWLEHGLHPWTSYAIVPVFAVANAGVSLSVDGIGDAARSPVAWAIVAGLVAGKPIGIGIARRLATRSGLAEPIEPIEPIDGSSRRQDAGIGAAAGVGFTVALFIAELAFRSDADRRDAKIGILVASALSAAISLALLRDRRPATAPKVPPTEISSA